MSYNKSRNRKSGFTFIEIMVVVVIIGLLAGLVTLKVRSSMNTAYVNKARSDIATLVSAIEKYSLDHNGQYPDADEKFANLDIRSSKDPWGNEYEYNCPASEGDEPYEVFSFGADGRPGGEGIDKDIYSWELEGKGE
jgi:general secretion pathway protein G